MGIFRPTRLAVATVRSAWLMPCSGLYLSSSSCSKLSYLAKVPNHNVKSPLTHLVYPLRFQEERCIAHVSDQSIARTVSSLILAVYGNPKVF